MKRYDKSYMPYPVKNFVYLDACQKITKETVKSSVWSMFPFIAFFTVYRQPNKGFMKETKFRQWPWRVFGQNFLVGMIMFNVVMNTYNLMTVDYCD